MRILYFSLLAFLWLFYLLYWWVKTRDVKETEQVHESVVSQLIRFVSMISAGVLLIFQNISLGVLDSQFIKSSTISCWIGVALTAVGLLFSVWTRNYLGENWSQAVMIKKDHQLITSGPYSIVRHPIYTGLLLAIIVSAIVIGEWRGIVAVLLVFGVLLYKLRVEEKWMRVKFGDAYELYAKRVAAFIPHFNKIG
jgi:protein-S-isoprenylcysteine O-methyltransferase Ste14